MTAAHLFAGLIAVIGVAAFIGTMIWVTDRDHEALRDTSTKPRLAPRPTTKPHTALPTTTAPISH